MNPLTANKKTDKDQQSDKTISGQTRIQKLAAELTRERNQSQTRRKIRRWIYWSLFLILIVAGYFVWRAYRPIPVNTSVVSYQRIGSTAQPILRLSGYVTYPRISTISARVQTPVIQLGFDVGDRVQRGALLAEFDHSELLTRRNVQQITIRDLQETLTRVQNLYKAGAASDADLQNAQTQLESARANLNLINTQIDNSIIRAPYSGLVIDKMVELGELATQGICRLADDSKILVEVDVNQEDIAKINADQSAVVLLDAYPETEYAADIYEIMPTADPSKNTIQVKVEVLKPDVRFKPNMSAKVFFTDERVTENSAVKAVLTVDKSAVFKRDGSTHLYIIQRGRVRERTVELGEPIGDRLLQIKSGVNPDQRVILNPMQYNLELGDRVEIL